MQLIRYKYFSAGLLSSNDQYPGHTKWLAERGLKLKKVLLHAPVVGGPWCEMHYHLLILDKYFNTGKVRFI